MTSFFPIPGNQNIIDTTNPPFPTAAFPPYPGSPQTVQGEPVTATNLQTQTTLPSFFGTSSASPNLAAVIALMKQANPTITRAGILSALESTATPLDGGGQSVWTPQGGYGLANAVKALAAAQQLSVLSITPGSGQTIGAIPKFITVTFNQPINGATISAQNLVVTGPNGSTVTVGRPVRGG